MVKSEAAIVIYTTVIRTTITNVKSFVTPTTTTTTTSINAFSLTKNTNANAYLIFSSLQVSCETEGLSLPPPALITIGEPFLPCVRIQILHKLKL